MRSLALRVKYVKDIICLSFPLKWTMTARFRGIPTTARRMFITIRPIFQASLNVISMGPAVVGSTPVAPAAEVIIPPAGIEDHVIYLAQNGTIIIM